MKAPWWSSALLVGCFAAPGQAQTPPVAAKPIASPITTAQPTSAEPAPQDATTVRGDDDEPTLSSITIGKWLTIGGTAQAEWNTVREPAGLASDEFEPEAGSSLQVRTALTPVQGVTLFAKVEGRRTFLTNVPDWLQTGDAQGRVVEGYADLDRVFGVPFGVRVGRQRFRDAQEWFFDDYLDAVRVRASAGRWRFDAALTGTVDRGDPLLRDTPQRRHVIATVSRRVTRAMRGTGIVIVRRDDQARADRPMWIGGSLASRGEHAVMFHLLGAIQRGRSGQARYRGWAFDGHVRWHITAAGRPAVSIGYARGSGDTDTNDGIDGGFRQTDLQDNSMRVGGIRRVRMYGEVFDPELANMHIVTAAASLRPAKWLSLDVLAHRYAQVVARRRLADHAFDVRASGRDTNLGDEIDLQVVARPAGRLDVRLVVGVFRPGAAFEAQPGASTSTVVFRPQVRLYF